MKYGLAISGGGPKGAYAIGVLKYLREVKNIQDYPIIYGTSTGSLIATLIAAYQVTGDFEHLNNLEHIYTHVKSGDVVQPNHSTAYAIGGEIATLAASFAFGGKGIYDSSGLEKLVDKFLSQDIWEKIIKKGQEKELELGFCTTNLKTGEGEIFTNINTPDWQDLKCALLASANQPVFMQPIKVKQQDYVDGGVVNATPLEYIFSSDFSNKISEIININLDVPMKNETDQKFEKIDSIVYRTVDILINNVLLEDIKTAQLYNAMVQLKDHMSDSQWEDYLKSLHPSIKTFLEKKLASKKYIPINHIEPQQGLEIGPFEFDPKKMTALFKKGFKDAKNQI